MKSMPSGLSGQGVGKGQAEVIRYAKAQELSWGDLVI